MENPKSPGRSPNSSPELSNRFGTAAVWTAAAVSIKTSFASAGQVQADRRMLGFRVF